MQYLDGLRLLDSLAYLLGTGSSKSVLEEVSASSVRIVVAGTVCSAD